MQHVTSGNALMVQVNSRVITEVTAVKGRAGSSLSRVEGEQQQRYRGGGEIWRTKEKKEEKLHCRSMKAKEEVRERVEITAVMVVRWEQEESLSELLNVLHC